MSNDSTGSSKAAHAGAFRLGLRKFSWPVHACRLRSKPFAAWFEGAPMPYFSRFTGAYGLHAGDLPGYPASSGWVRLPQRHAKRFFDAVRAARHLHVQFT
jgi:hypothetical protein